MAVRSHRATACVRSRPFTRSPRCRNRSSLYRLGMAARTRSSRTASGNDELLMDQGDEVNEPVRVYVLIRLTAWLWSVPYVLVVAPGDDGATDLVWRRLPGWGRRPPLVAASRFPGPPARAPVLRRSTTARARTGSSGVARGDCARPWLQWAGRGDRDDGSERAVRGSGSRRSRTSRVAGTSRARGWWDARGRPAVSSPPRCAPHTPRCGRERRRPPFARRCDVSRECSRQTAFDLCSSSRRRRTHLRRDADSLPSWLCRAASRFRAGRSRARSRRSAS